MTETDDTETRLTRREALKGGSAAAVAAGSFLLQKQLVQAASAQTTEPRIKLGQDWTIDDDPNGNGNLVTTEQNTGNAFTRQPDGVFNAPTVETKTEFAYNNGSGRTSVELLQTIRDTDDTSTFDHTLNNFTTHQWYILKGVIENPTGSNAVVATQINGETGSNYRRQLNDGTTQTGLSKLDILSVPAGSWGPIEAVYRGGNPPTLSDFTSTANRPTVMVRSVAVHSTALVYVAGDLDVSGYSDTTSIRLFATGSENLTGELGLYGVNFDG